MTSKFAPLIVCIGCGAQKGDANHWFLLAAHSPSVGTCVGQRRYLEISDFELALAEEPRQHPACGHNCVQKLVERWLVTGSLEAPRGPAADPVSRGV
jgi:hypothetical protein